MMISNPDDAESNAAHRGTDPHARTKDDKPMAFALLPPDPTDEEEQRFVDFLNGEGEFAEKAQDSP